MKSRTVAPRWLLALVDSVAQSLVVALAWPLEASLAEPTTLRKHEKVAALPWGHDLRAGPPLLDSVALSAAERWALAWGQWPGPEHVSPPVVVSTRLV